LAPPCTAAKVNDLGFKAIEGVGITTFSVTGTVNGEFEEPGAEIWMPPA
jgi:hypothetical protein